LEKSCNRVKLNKKLGRKTIMSKKRAIIFLSIIGFLTLIGVIFLLVRMKVDVSGTALLPKEDPAYKSMKKMEEIFGSSRTMMVILKKRNGDVFSDEVIKKLFKIEDKLKELPYVLKVDSILKAQKVSLRFTIRGIDVKATPYFPEGSVSSFSKDILKDGLYVGNLIDPEGKVIAFILQVEESDALKIVENIKEVFEEISSDFEIYMTGEPVADAELESSIWILAFFYPPILFGLIWFLYFLRLGSALAAVIPPVISIISALWTYEIASLIGIPLNILTATVGIFIIIVSSSYGLHFVDRYIEYRLAMGLQDSVRKTLESEKIPITLSAVTTAIAFLSFIFTPLSAFKQLGILVALGVMLSAISSLVLIIPVISLFDVHKIKRRYLVLNVEFGKHWKTFSILAIIGIVISFSLLVNKIEVNMDQFSYFGSNSKVKVASDISNKYFGWTLPLYILIEKERPFTSEDQKVLREIVRRIEELDGVNDVTSILDVAESFKVPLPILQMLSRTTDEFKDLIRGNVLRLLVKTPYTDTLRTERLVKKIQEILKDYDEYAFDVTGPVVVTASLNSKIVKSQFITVAVSFLFIFGLLVAVFRKIVISLVASIPIILTTFLNFILMAIVRISLEIATSIVSSMLMGLVIDYSIHFVSKYLTMKSIKKVIQEVGAVILSNSIGLSAGFASLLFAPLILYVKLGFLLCVGIFAGMILTILIIPPFLEKA